jgi:hypothetical protein
MRPNLLRGCAYEEYQTARSASQATLSHLRLAGVAIFAPLDAFTSFRANEAPIWLQHDLRTWSRKSAKERSVLRRMTG